MTTELPEQAPAAEDPAHAASAREQFARAVSLLDQGQHALQRAIAELPEFNGTSACCGSPDLKVITDCLAQWCRLDQDSLIAATNGWSDMGDMDGPEHVECQSCGAVWRSPARLNWL